MNWIWNCSSCRRHPPWSRIWSRPSRGRGSTLPPSGRPPGLMWDQREDLHLTALCTSLKFLLKYVSTLNGPIKTLHRCQIQLNILNVVWTGFVNIMTSHNIVRRRIVNEPSVNPSLEPNTKIQGPHSHTPQFNTKATHHPKGQWWRYLWACFWADSGTLKTWPSALSDCETGSSTTCEPKSNLQQGMTHA